MGAIALLVDEATGDENFTEFNRRIIRYLSAGIPLIWVVDHSERMVTVFRRGKGMRVYEEGKELSGYDVLPGFGYRVSEFFVPSDQVV